MSFYCWGKQIPHDQKVGGMYFSLFAAEEQMLFGITK